MSNIIHHKGVFKFMRINSMSWPSFGKDFLIHPVSTIAPLHEPDNLQFFQRIEDPERSALSQSAYPYFFLIKKTSSTLSKPDEDSKSCLYESEYPSRCRSWWLLRRNPSLRRWWTYAGHPSDLRSQSLSTTKALYSSIKSPYLVTKPHNCGYSKLQALAWKP